MVADGYATTEIASLRSHYEVLTTDNNKTAPSSSTRGNEISPLPVKTLSHRTNSDYGLAYLGISASKHQFHKNVSLLLQAQLNSRKKLKNSFPVLEIVVRDDLVRTMWSRRALALTAITIVIRYARAEITYRATSGDRKPLYASPAEFSSK